MTSTQLEYTEKRMQQKWRDLVMAEQQGATIQSLERMYHAYMLLAEEYNRCSEEYRREQSQHQNQMPWSPAPIQTKRKRTPASASSTRPLGASGYKKLA